MTVAKCHRNGHGLEQRSCSLPIGHSYLIPKNNLGYEPRLLLSPYREFRR